MARRANKLTRIQQNEEVFTGLKEQIAHFTPAVLETLGHVSRTTLYKYARREPVNPGTEKEIKRVLKLALEKEDNDGNLEVEDAKQLIMA